jgi:hypothetical protein
MPATPAKTMEYLNGVLIPWKETAHEDEFSETKVVEFEADVKESVDIRAEIANLEAEVETKKKMRDRIDERNKAKAQMIVSSVAGHPKYGKDSGLYKAMGFVTTSERKSGLTRKKKKTTTPTP